MKSRLWRTQFTSCSSIHVRNISHFFLFLFKIMKIPTNNPMLVQYFFLPSEAHKWCHFLLKNIILYQKLHINHWKKIVLVFWRYSDIPDTLRFSPCSYYICSIFWHFISCSFSILYFHNMWWTKKLWAASKKFNNYCFKLNTAQGFR